ncbi:Methyltransferase domain family [Candidatus Sulfotelmatobacter sp. SbA7]|nr:Methyltransferase domain family [Candidatus Sulfotelmatobacter sp. SbA7]
MSDCNYVGNYVGLELELFAAVRKWKTYWSRQIRPFIHGDVIEVGAGIGSNTPFLDPIGGEPGGDHRWVCLEPDPLLLAQLTKTLKETTSRQYETLCGTLQTVDGSQRFDTIIYIDVLEHIANDREELNIAADRLRPGGRIIVLAPAHQWLFSPFDAAIGHFRRYNRSMLRSISPAGLMIEKLIYLDSAGLTASAANLLFFRQSMPTKAQLSFWDHWIVPASQVMDKLLLHSVGKSIVAIWRKN